MRAAWAACVSLALACGGAADPRGGTTVADAQRYAELVARPDPAPAQALADCATLHDPDLAGDCGLAVALQARARGADTLDALCPQVPDGAWQDECYFMLAEDALRARDPESAAAACMRSGAFKDDCGQHLWQGDLRKLVRGTRGQLLPERVERAQTLFDRWLPRLVETDITWRFWQRFFERVTEHQPGVKLSRCDGLATPELRVRCRYGSSHLYLRRVWDILHHPKGRGGLCRLAAGDVAAAEATFAELQAEPDPLLSAVLEEARGAACSGDQLRPVEDGVLSRRALEAALAGLPPTP